MNHIRAELKVCKTYDQIESVYRKYVKECHPDMELGSEEKFKELQQLIVEAKTSLKNYGIVVFGDKIIIGRPPGKVFSVAPTTVADSVIGKIYTANNNVIVVDNGKFREHHKDMSTYMMSNVADKQRVLVPTIETENQQAVVSKTPAARMLSDVSIDKNFSKPHRLWVVSRLLYVMCMYDHSGVHVNVHPTTVSVNVNDHSARIETLHLAVMYGEKLRGMSAQQQIMLADYIRNKEAKPVHTKLQVHDTISAITGRSVIEISARFNDKFGAFMRRNNWTHSAPLSLLEQWDEVVSSFGPRKFAKWGE